MVTCLRGSPPVAEVPRFRSVRPLELRSPGVHSAHMWAAHMWVIRNWELVMGGEGEERKGGRRLPKDQEVGVRYGGRNYLIYPGQRLVAQDGPWHLVTVPAWTEGGWLNFKLYLNRKAKKNLWHLGVKDGQPSKSREKKLLEDHHPGRIDWVVKQAELLASGKIRMKAERGKAVIYSAGKGWRIRKEQD